MRFERHDAQDLPGVLGSVVSGGQGAQLSVGQRFVVNCGYLDNAS